MPQRDAILLLGPTGSGKTPLGEHLAEAGLWGRRCAHFDFGARLREVDAGPRAPEGLSEADVAVVVRSLRTGALLERDQFHIARHLLLDFAGRHTSAHTLLILNGLPRHVDQAEDVDRLVLVIAVLRLDAPAGVVFERIQANRGGDRGGRVDDGIDAVANRLHLFQERTMPLVEHYRRRGAHLVEIPIGIDTTPASIGRFLNTLEPAGGAADRRRPVRAHPGGAR